MKIKRWSIILVCLIILFGAFAVVAGLPWENLTTDSINENSLMMGMGIMGAIACIICPVYLIGEVKEGNYESGLAYGFAGFLVGFTLVVAWLWH